MKSKCGFTLVEVLMALIILVGTATIILGFNVKSVMRVLRGREKTDRVFLIEEELNNIFLKLPEKEKIDLKEIEDPEVKIKTELLEVSKKSSLKDFAKSIKILKSEGTWKQSADKQNLKMISFVKVTQKKEK